MNTNPMLGAYIGIGVGVLFILIMIIVIPRRIKKTKQRGQQAADNMIKDFENRTGLKWNGQQFTGTYKGYNAQVEKSIAYNKAKIVDGVTDILTDAKYKENMHGNTTVYPTLKIKLEKSTANFPDVTLFQTGNYGSTEGARKMLDSAELRTLMSSWIYPDLRADKTQITLELNNPGIIPKWGHNKTSGIDWMIQGLDICVAAGNALS